MSLIIYSGIILSLFMAVAVLINSELKAIEAETLAQKDKNINAILLAQEMRFSSAQVHQWYTDVSATRDPAGYEEVEFYANKFREDLKKLSVLDNSLVAYNEVSADFETFYQVGRKMAEAYIYEGTEAGNVVMEEFDQIAGTMANTCLQIVEGQQSRLDSSYLSILATSSKIKKELTISLGVFLAIIIMSSFLVIKKIVSPLNRMIAGASKYTEGNFKESIQIKTNDELGLLGDSLNQMAFSLKKLIGEIMEASQNLDAKSQELAAASEEVGASTQQVASSTIDIVSKTEESVESANGAVDKSKQVLMVADQGNLAVKNTLNKIEIISSYTLEAGEGIKELGQLSSNISNITNVITDIADQTNLLALNAAIEAARAGEQGKGFAVVAEEVRKLAEQSGKAAKEIGGLVKQIESKVEASVRAVERNVEEVNEGVSLAAEAGKALEQIVQAVEGVVKEVEEISLNIGETHERISELSEANEQISSTIEQVVVTTQELATMSGELNDVINRFEV